MINYSTHFGWKTPYRSFSWILKSNGTGMRLRNYGKSLVLIWKSGVVPFINSSKCIEIYQVHRHAPSSVRHFLTSQICKTLGNFLFMQDIGHEFQVMENRLPFFFFRSSCTICPNSMAISYEDIGICFPISSPITWHTIFFESDSEPERSNKLGSSFQAPFTHLKS